MGFVEAAERLAALDARIAETKDAAATAGDGLILLTSAGEVFWAGAGALVPGPATVWTPSAPVLTPARLAAGCCRTVSRSASWVVSFQRVSCDQSRRVPRSVCAAVAVAQSYRPRAPSGAATSARPHGSRGSCIACRESTSI